MHFPGGVFIERDSAEWRFAWAHLLVLTGDADLAMEDKDTGEIWQYMGTWLQPSGWMHQFRHRHHPVRQRRWEIDMLVSPAFTPPPLPVAPAAPVPEGVPWPPPGQGPLVKLTLSVGDYAYRDESYPKDAPPGLGSFRLVRRWPGSIWVPFVYVSPRGYQNAVGGKGGSLRVPLKVVGEIELPQSLVPPLPQSEHRYTSDVCSACGKKHWIEIFGVNAGYCTYCYHRG